MSGEWIAYWMVRTGVAAAGLIALLATVSSYALMPGLYYDDLPTPPPMPERLPGIAAGLGVAVLLLLPNRLTLRGWPFWTRLALSAAVGSLFIVAGVGGIAAGLHGGKDPVIFPVLESV